MIQRILLLVVLAVAAFSTSEVCINFLCHVWLSECTPTTVYLTFPSSPVLFYNLYRLLPLLPSRRRLSSLLPQAFSGVVLTLKRKRSSETEKTWENFPLPESVEPAEERSWKRPKHLKPAKRRTNSSRNASSPETIVTKQRNKLFTLL